MDLQLTALDAIILGVVLLSTVMAFARGILREIVSIASIGVGILAVALLLPLARKYAGPYFPNAIPLWGQDVILISIIFIVAFLAISLVVGQVRGMLVQSDTITLIDRVGGAIYGAARGALLIGIAGIILNSFIPKDLQPKWITEARLYPLAQKVTKTIVAMAPTPQQATRAIVDSAKQAGKIGDELANRPGRTLITPDNAPPTATANEVAPAAPKK